MELLYNIIKSVIALAGLVAFVFFSFIGPLTIVLGLIRAFSGGGTKDTGLLITGLKRTFLYGLGGIVLVAVLFALVTLVGTVTGVTVTNLAITNTVP